MKKIVISILLILVSNICGAQIFGQFSYQNDGRLYFLFQNQSSYALSVSAVAYSPLTGAKYSETINMSPGQAFIFGPSTPARWSWLEGDTFTIFYSNGQSVYWRCPESDRKSPSFQSRRNGHPCNIPNHHCSGYIDENHDNICDVCPGRCHATNHNTTNR